MILMVLAAYFGAVTPEELIVFLETGMKREADLLMAPGGIQEEQADALYAVTYLQMKELQPFLTEWYKTSDFAFSGLMLAECRKYHIDAVAKYTAIMKFLRFDEALFIREGREFLRFQQRSSGSFGYLNPLAIIKGRSAANCCTVSISCRPLIMPPPLCLCCNVSLLKDGKRNQ